MRVLVVNTVGMFANGITSVIMEEYKCMNNIQYDFVSASSIDKDIQEKIFEKDSKIYVLSRKKNPIKYMIELYKICKKEKYNAIHVHGNSATMFFDLFPAWMAKIPTRIAHCHNSRCDYVKLNNFLLPLFKQLYTKAIACSTLAGDWLFGKENYTVINNSIVVDDFIFDNDVRIKYRNDFGILPKQFVLGHVGLVNKQKNAIFLIEIMREIVKKNDNIVLFLVGEGNLDLTIEIQNRISKYNLEKNVKMLEKRTDVNNLMQMFDLFVLPSLWEGLGIVLIEAQCSGLMCIASDCVPKTANVSGNVKFVNLNSVQNWINFIIDASNIGTNDRNNRSKLNCKQISCLGYDKEALVDSLSSLYKI